MAQLLRPSHMPIAKRANFRVCTESRRSWRVIPVFLLGLAGILVLTQPVQAAIGTNKEELLTRILMRSLQSGHFSAPTLDESFDKSVLDLYLKRLDPQKRFLLQSDIELLRQQQSEIDDQLRQGRDDLSETANKLLQQRISDAQKMVQEILQQPLNLEVPDSLPAQGEKLPWCKNREALKERWLHLLKFQVLTRLDDAQETLEKKEKERQDSLQKSMESDTLRSKGNLKTTVTKKLPKKESSKGKKPTAVEEKTARDYVSRNVQRIFKRMSKEERFDRVSEYLNAIANVFDPHTEYFKPEAKEEFDLNMTGRLEGIGAVLKEEDGYIKVVSIVPGSASWRQKELKAEDKILKVAQADGEAVDLTDASVNEAVKLIRGKKGTEVRLTVQHPDGQIKVIPIFRDVVVVEETYAKSAVLNAPGGSRVGYIFLPAFYHDFSNPKARSASGDVAKEVERLKAEKVQGIILDFRNNGGGALEDAVKMAGLFFKDGPVVQVRDTRNEMNVLKDTDPSVLWDGPLMVMVNTFSASASEIVAAALQDYGRAVIFGTDTTFGKGTVQTLVDLDGFVPPAYQAYRPMGTLKLTIQKFYRVNGGSTQFKGVVPDVLVPDAYARLEVGERNLDNPLPWDTVNALNTPKGPLTRSVLEGLRQKSTSRLLADAKSQRFISLVARMEKNRQREEIPLKRADFFNEQARARQEGAEFDSLQKNIASYTVIPLSSSKASDADSVEAEKSKRWKEQLVSDFYLREGVSVMDDLIEQKAATQK